MVRNPFQEGVAVQIRGDSSGLRGAVSNAIGSLGSLKMAAAGAGVALGALAVGGLALSTKAAADFESAMVEVEKVTSPETADQMADSIRRMSGEMPVAQAELAGIAAQAGRFGVEGPENIERFTESVAKMAVATDLSTEQAGEAFARMTTLMDEPISNVQNLGDAVNGLSNTMATSASEITNASVRSSGALSQLGLQSDEILALNASMNEVSASSRIAGTRLRRFAQELQDPGKTEDLAEALGMTVGEFETMREESPNELMELMVQRFQEGGDSADALRSTLSTTSRQALAGLAQNTEGWAEAQEVANEQMGEGESLNEEYAAAADTFNNKLQIMKNRLRNIAIEIGEEVLPAATEFVEVLTDGLATIEGWIDGTEEGNEQTEAFADGISDLQSRTSRSLSKIRRVYDRHLGDIAMQVQDILGSIRAFWNRHGDAITSIVSRFWNFIEIAIVGHLDRMFTIINVALALIRGDWDMAWQQISGLLSRQWDRMVSIVENAIPLMKQALGLLIRIYVGLIKEMSRRSISLVKGLFRGASDWIISTGTSLFESAFGDVIDTVQDAAEWLLGSGEGTLFGGITSTLQGIGDWVRNNNPFGPLIGMIQTIINKVDKAIRKLNRLSDMDVDVPGSGSIPSIDIPNVPSADVPDIPGIASGGRIERGGAAILHAGEEVVPAADVDRRGGGGGDKIVIQELHASGRREGRAAGKALKMELRSQGIGQ